MWDIARRCVESRYASPHYGHIKFWADPDLCKYQHSREAWLQEAGHRRSDWGCDQNSKENELARRV